jgi:hypothetical protein
MTMVEARKADRVRAFLRARIVFNNMNSTIDCTIKNISATGAKIELGNTITIPTEFDLDVPARGRVYRARLMWRDSDAVGVAFEEMPASADQDVTRVEKLDREIRKLKQTVATLTKRLVDLGQDVSSNDW